MKQFKKIALRLVCLLCVVGLFGFALPKTAEAAEFFDPYPLKWSDYSYYANDDYSVQLKWIKNANVTDTKITSNIPYALTIWRSTDHLTTVQTTSSTLNKVEFKMPTASEWASMLNVSDTYSTLGHTSIYLYPDGHLFTGYADSAALSNGLIRNAVIYFNQTSGRFTKYSNVQMRNLIAHEMGHALGFAHPDVSPNYDTNSIMLSGISTRVALSGYDLDCFRNKYNAP